ncbi:hypothetical protein CIHG_10561 [Coccidioides immitis H538.4]|uniref:Uncharacterized protein n=1 Tax=Coccidioides immitis H538.4 TaxID=396776 RepID=A0A0P6Q2X4_COCIT|nr:hypothetical protein CIHG_10561 [Coccidioides immitis H538.4]
MSKLLEFNPAGKVMEVKDIRNNSPVSSMLGLPKRPLIGTHLAFLANISRGPIEALTVHSQLAGH